MRSALLLLLALVIAPVCGAQNRWYVDPSYDTIQYADLSRPTKPLLLKLSVNVTINGSPDYVEPSYVSFRRAEVAQVLRKSGLIRSSHAGEDGSIVVTLDEAWNKTTSERRGPGAHTRFVRRLVAVIDAGGRNVTREYEHAYFWYQGKAKEPESLKNSMTGGEAEYAIHEQMLLRALRDFQEEDSVIPKSVN